MAVDLAAGVLDGPVREKRLAAGDADGGVVLQRGDQASQPVGAHFRILVEQDEDGIALGGAQAAVAAGGKAEVGLVADQADVRVVALHEAGGAVVGRVVYDVGVEGDALLTLQRGQAGRQVAHAIPDGQDNGDGGRLRQGCSSGLYWRQVRRQFTLRQMRRRYDLGERRKRRRRRSIQRIRRMKRPLS